MTTMANDLILVTGATGHLGANLVRSLLADREKVRALLLPGTSDEAVKGLPLDLVWGGLRRAGGVRRGCEGVGRGFRAAAQSSTIDGTEAAKRQLFETNVTGTRNLLAGARAAGVQRVVFTGSFSATGHDLDDQSAVVD